MTTTDRLAKIRARCVELLELASKRTPEGWETDCDARHPAVFTSEGDFIGVDMSQKDAAYIAACAGAAEAAWKATIAAIDGLLPISEQCCNCWADMKADDAIAAILAAWEGQI